jgi:leucine dehydrogenase
MFYDHPDFDDHHSVHVLSEARAGLRAIIAIHRVSDDAPAVGGIRFRPYPDDEAALADALRLSAAMTFKVVLAGLPVRGGKTVILGDPQTQKTPELLRALGREIEALGGRYLGGPDVGTTPADMDVIRQVTSFVGGSTERMGPGGSAPPTAAGVFNAVRALAAHLNGDADLTGVHVAVQGVGAVGADLADRLAEAGARLSVADVDSTAAHAVAARTGATVVPAEEALFVDADILAPCALGAVLSKATIPRLAVRGICGAANNQLATAADAGLLRDRKISFVPDFVASAGGVIAGIAAEGIIEADEADQRIARIFDRSLSILQHAAHEGLTETDVATRMAAALLSQE